jgi:hypothetical protein
MHRQGIAALKAIGATVSVAHHVQYHIIVGMHNTLI